MLKAYLEKLLFAFILSIFCIPQVASAEVKFPKLKEIKKNKDRSPHGKKLYYVTGQSGGQMGNQMFCIATTLAYAWDNGLIPMFPFLAGTDANKPLNCEQIFFRLNINKPPVNLKLYQDHSCKYNPIPPEKNVALFGAFFSWKYFHHHRARLQDIFSPSQETVNYLNTKYSDLIAHPFTVGVHVRTTSKEVHQKMVPFPGLKYFEIAMDNFPSQALFVVFSDRINWCKKKLFGKISR